MDCTFSSYNIGADPPEATQEKKAPPHALIIERISSRERIGETLPTVVQRVNFIEVIPAPVAAPAPESYDPAQDTPPLNISADEKDLTPIDLDLPLLTPNS